MERSRLGLVMISVGAILFVISLISLLQQFDLYLISLFAMVISVILIAVGFAYTRREEISIDNSD